MADALLRFAIGGDDLANTYLAFAYEALEGAIDTDRPGRLALRQRVDESRKSLLFSALASEAYINQFSSLHLSPADFKALDRLPTLEKYIFIPELVLSRPLFRRGEHPLNELKRLFSLRHALVHPKARTNTHPTLEEEFTYAEHNPAVAAEMLLSVVHGGRALADESQMRRDFLDWFSMTPERERNLVKRAEWVREIPMPTAKELVTEMDRLGREHPDVFVTDPLIAKWAALSDAEQES